MCQAAWVLPMGGLGGSEFDLVAQKMAVKFSKEAPIFKRSFYLSRRAARQEPPRAASPHRSKWWTRTRTTAALAAITARGSA